LPPTRPGAALEISLVAQVATQYLTLLEDEDQLESRPSDARFAVQESYNG
jgi:hypothetical protein